MKIFNHGLCTLGLLSMVSPIGLSHAAENPTTPQSVQLVSRGPARALPNTFWGANLKFTQQSLWGESRWTEKVDGFKLKLLRYPGGAAANYWDWHAEGIRKPGREGVMGVHPLSEFSAALKRMDAEAVFCLNMLTSTLAEQVSMLRHAESLGIDVRYVELGNEFYLKRYKKEYPDGRAYGKQVVEWLPVLRKEFPAAHYGVVGSIGQGSLRDLRRKHWNRDVFRAVTNADAVIFHPYVGAGLELPGRRLPMGAYTEDQVASMEEQFQTPAGLEAILSQPFLRMEGLLAQQNVPEDLPWWFTEYNLHEKQGPVANSWAQGLVVGGLVMTHIQEPRVEMSLFHQLEGGRTFAAVFHYLERYSDPDGVQTMPWTYSASGHVLKLMGEVLVHNPTVEVLASKLSSNSEQVPQLLAVRSRAAKDKFWKMAVLNLSSEVCIPDLEAADLSSLHGYSLYTDPTRLVVDTSLPERITWNEGGSIELPPFSFSLIYGKDGL